MRSSFKLEILVHEGEPYAVHFVSANKHALFNQMYIGQFKLCLTKYLIHANFLI